MLILSRAVGEKIVIDYHGTTLSVTLVSIDRGKVRLGIEAPQDVPIFRKELLEVSEEKGG